jgi:hypothetical protein
VCKGWEARMGSGIYGKVIWCGHREGSGEDTIAFFFMYGTAN